MPKDENIPTAPPPRPDPKVFISKPHPREVRGDTDADEWTAFEQSAAPFLNELAGEMNRYRLAIIAGVGVCLTALCCGGPVFLCGFKIGEMISVKTSSGHRFHFTQPEEHRTVSYNWDPNCSLSTQ